MRRPYRSISLTILLAALAASGFFWSLQTHWVKSFWWHNTHGDFVSIGGWTFTVPRAWYVETSETGPNAFSRQVGLFDARRATLSNHSSTIDVWAGFRAANVYPVPQEWSQVEQGALRGQGYTRRDPMPVGLNTKRAQCVMGEADSAREPRFIEYCLFQDAELFVTLKAARIEDLAEAAAIIRTGRSMRRENKDRVDPSGGRVDLRTERFLEEASKGLATPPSC
jgi:hypothetical protein